MRVPSTNHRDIPVFASLVCQLPICCGCHGAIAGSSLAYASKTSAACVKIACTASWLAILRSDR
jgi:hypothetical protein